MLKMAHAEITETLENIADAKDFKIVQVMDGTITISPIQYEKINKHYVNIGAVTLKEVLTYLSTKTKKQWHSLT